MREFKGTKGSWQTYLHPSTQKTIVVGEEKQNGKKDIICVFPLMTEDCINEANAHLIAAAPDLLAFAIDFVEKVESGRAKSTDSYNKAKAAINKALLP